MREYLRIFGLTPGEFVWLFAAIGVLLAYEIFALLFPQHFDVLTRAMRANSARWTLWPVAAGIIMGHLFGPRLESPPPYLIAWIAIPVLALARDLFVRTPVPQIAVFGIFFVSVAVGAVAWSGRP